MSVQLFKGDAQELKFKAVGDPVVDLTNSALDDLYENGYNSSPFLLMLYDENRMPFSERIPREAFVDFIKEALNQFTVTGTFEVYLFILKSIFGSETEISFDIPSPGILNIDVGAIASSEFDFIGREYSGGLYTFFDMIDSSGAKLILRGVPGIETEYELDLLLSEIIPAGITAHVSLQFFARFDFVAEYDDSDPILYDVITQNTNNIIFYEIGG